MIIKGDLQYNGELAKIRNSSVKKGSVSEIVSNSDVPILIDTSLEVD